jgi:hypothetical protein
MPAAPESIRVDVVGAPDDDDLIDDLPTAYAVVLRLHRGGACDDDIALALGAELSAVPSLIDLAAAKLDDLRRRRS